MKDIIKVLRDISPVKLAILIGLFVWLVYYQSNNKPIYEFNYFVYLADSFLHGHADVPNLPPNYFDFVLFDGKKYLPFPFMPAVSIMPLVAIFGTGVREIVLSQIIGAIDVSLLFLLLVRMKVSKPTALFITAFYGFGTVQWYISAIGWSWFFAHVLAQFFLLLCLLEVFGKGRLFIVGFLAALAGLSREPLLLAAPFIFILTIVYQKNIKFSVSILKFLPAFIIGFSPFFVLLIYNYARFGSIFEQGYQFLYKTYISSNITYSFYRNIIAPGSPHFGYFDLRNIPLGLYTIFFFPPEIMAKFPFFKPSPYGLSIFITSPLFIFILKSKINSFYKNIFWLMIFPVALVSLLHYAQGWVQFGYRFLLDYIIFLLILLAFSFKTAIPKLALVLLIISIIINFWGINWAMGKF